MRTTLFIYTHDCIFYPATKRPVGRSEPADLPVDQVRLWQRLHLPVADSTQTRGDVYGGHEGAREQLHGRGSESCVEPPRALRSARYLLGAAGQGRLCYPGRAHREHCGGE